jgi:hypothetical protein
LEGNRIAFLTHRVTLVRNEGGVRTSSSPDRMSVGIALDSGCRHADEMAATSHPLHPCMVTLTAAAAALRHAGGTARTAATTACGVAAAASEEQTADSATPPLMGLDCA